MISGRQRGAAWAVAVVIQAACGASSPPPETITAGEVTIQTDPLVLHLTTPRGAFTVERFVEVGTVDFFDDGKYYDPRDPMGSGVNWSAATRATGYDDQSGMLTLDNGVLLSLSATGGELGATITVDAGGVERAVLVRAVLPRDPTEPIFGFGESFTSAEAGGTVREMQFRVDTDF
ncbi:MAG TPA: hypothetical protein VML75_28820, partial [Kofleriaceae bacterium]|nr:hypothetical protein [Kofleriaceae bacterium]